MEVAPLEVDTVFLIQCLLCRICIAELDVGNACCSSCLAVKDNVYLNKRSQ